MTRLDPSSSATSVDTADEPTRIWGPPTAVICGSVLTTYIAFGAVIPLLPKLVLGGGGGGPVAMGLVIAVSSLTSLLCRPFCGRLAQRMGSRPIMVCGCLLGAVAGALYTAPIGLAGLLLARVVTGLSIATLFTAGAVWIVALVPTRRRGQVMGWYGLAGWGGMAIGPPVTTVLPGGSGAVWWLIALLPLPAIAMLLTLTSERPPPAQPVHRRLVPKAVLGPGLSLALAASGYSAAFGFIALHLGARGVAGGATMIGVFAASYLAARLLAGHLPDRVGRRPMFLGCVATETAGLLLITLAHSRWAATAGTVLLGAGLSMLYPTLALQVLDRTRTEERGAALGAYTSFWDLGLAATGALSGLIALYGGYSAVFASAAALCVLASLVGLVSHHDQQPAR